MKANSVFQAVDIAKEKIKSIKNYDLPVVLIPVYSDFSFLLRLDLEPPSPGWLVEFKRRFNTKINKPEYYFNAVEKMSSTARFSEE